MREDQNTPKKVQPTRVSELREPDATTDTPQVPATVPGTRPDAPDELSAEERTEWAKFVTRMPEDWFPPETWPMLAQLCRHICQSRWVGQCLQEVRAGLLDPTKDDALERCERLQRMHDREGRAITAMMVRLRLTSQQRIPDADVADRARDRVKDEHVDTLPWAVSGRAIGTRQ